MASISYVATEEMTNINRVSRLLMDPCTDQLRDLLRSFIPPANFNTVIQTVKSQLPRLTEPQRKLILPSSGVYFGNYDDMDISLLYILLRNVCGIQAHNQGWGNSPDSADRSVSANIERLRLARNLCGHSTGGMSNAEFNQVWSEIRAAVMDLDKTLGIGNKYQEAVDFIRNDTMDPTRDRHFSDQLQEQIKETENIKKDVQSLKKQHKTLLESWLKGDKPFHEIHSFPDILDKVQSQPVTTIIGGPGSGKTTTARHLALRLQTDCEFEIVPVDDITEIKQYGHPKYKLVFILDDVIGVFGVEYEKLRNLEKYKESILNALGERSKILFTCRKAVYKEAANLKSFVLDKEYLVDLVDSKNQLNAEDRLQILNNHCKSHGISLKPDELPNVSSTVGCMMYPLLCKLFCSKSEYQALGKEFFENPYVCIRKEMDYLQGHMKIQYASLILCMFCQNEINEIMMKKDDSRFIEIKEKVFENCRVSGRNSEIKDALDHMNNTFTIRTDKRYSLIHDSVFEALAFHYGNQFQEDMLEYMSSSFVAKKFSISDISDDSGDLHIKIHKEHYSAFAKRLVTKHKESIRRVLAWEVQKRSKNSYISDLDEQIRLLILGCYSGNLEVVKLLLKHCDIECAGHKDIVGLLIKNGADCNKNDEKGPTPFCRATGAVHEDIVNLLNESVADCNKRDRYGPTPLCYASGAGHVDIVKMLIKSGADCNTNDGKGPTPLCRASRAGHEDIVDLLIKNGADCNKSDRYGATPLCYASGAGHVDIVDLLIKSGADSNTNDGIGPTPLCQSSGAGHVDIVDLLIKSGADCNKSDGKGATPLCYASYAGHVYIVDLLIKSGADCNKSDKFGNTSLCRASHAGHVDIVDLLIKSGADCNKNDGKGTTPLCQASGAGHVDIVKMLIKSGADCNKSDGNGTTPLCYASYAGDGDIVDSLIKNGADCNKSNGKGPTPLCLASRAGHVDIVDLLIKSGADCKKSDGYGFTPLCQASRTGHVDIVDLLIKSGADCNKSDGEGPTPLCYASDAGYEDIMDLLIKSGADWNKSNEKGVYPLNEASRAGHVYIVDLLIKSGADCNKSDKFGNTPLCQASHAGHVDIVDLLIKSGADCNKSDEFGNTPLCRASLAGHVDIVDLLIKSVADCNKSNVYGKTPLCQASRTGHVDIVDLLIKSGADCNKSDGNGPTPLCYASRAGHEDIVDLLIKSGADCNKSDGDGVTPLCYASCAGHLDIVKMLIKSGADCNKSDGYGTTPLCQASCTGHVDIVDLLIKSGADCSKSDGRAQLLFVTLQVLVMKMKFTRPSATQRDLDIGLERWSFVVRSLFVNGHSVIRIEAVGVRQIDKLIELDIFGEDALQLKFESANMLDLKRMEMEHEFKMKEMEMRKLE
uniref:Uncharacterized protein LOC111105207 n=1 Tax=Crassostrea virginica TaxID=6565 RepID=A0A8B8AXR1_CRAVI|nr:uncharacterized protein LOC111105207 [Crassostrea virginica]